MSREEILYSGDSHRPQTSPALCNKQLESKSHSHHLCLESDFTPCTERSDERLFHSWQYYGEQRENSENTTGVRCMTADLPKADSASACQVHDVIALDWFSPARSSSGISRRSCTDMHQHRISIAKPSNMPGGLRNCSNEATSEQQRAARPPMPTWASRYFAILKNCVITTHALCTEPLPAWPAQHSCGVSLRSGMHTALQSQYYCWG